MATIQHYPNILWKFLRYTSIMENSEKQSNLFELPPWQGDAILLVDLDAFFASVEQADHPGWRGKPVIVGGDANKHGVVATASYEARQFGVRSAMPASQAERLCPQAIWTHGHFDRYREVSNQIMAILRSESPYVQQVSIDEAFMDVTPTRANKEHPVAIANRIQKRVEELGVTCSIGVGTTKTIAKIASDMDKPRGITVVYPGEEQSFLSPLPVRTMSGIGKASEKVLVDYGVRTLGDLSVADEGLLKKVFGKNAGMMRERAQGGDKTPVEQDDTVKSVSNEVTYAQDLSTREEIQAALATIAAKVGRRLRKKGLKGHVLSLKVRYHDQSTKQVQRQLSPETDDELFYTPYLYQMLDEVWAPGIPVRLLGVGMSGFEGNEVLQESLFDDADLGIVDDEPKSRIQNEDKRRGLLSATDAVKNKFGETAVRYGRDFRQGKNTTGSMAKNPEDYK